MGVPAGEISLNASKIVTNTAANGGIAGALLPDGTMNNIFPVVLEEDRIAGVTRYRKIFLKNSSVLDASMYLARLYLLVPSPAGDNFRIAAGTDTDTQSAIEADQPHWVGTGDLKTALSGAETSVDVTMETNDFEFLPGEYMMITGYTPTGQTLASGVLPGDSVQNTEADPANMAAGAWEKVAFSNDWTYPKGRVIKAGQVATISTVADREMVQIKDTQITDEDIGDGDGANQTPALSTLSNPTNGIMGGDYAPVVTATCGGTERVVNVADDGSCSGYCSAGQLNMTTGAWTTPITWTTAPDNATDILIDYARKPYSYTGNDATVELESTVANAYTTGNTTVCHCIGVDELITSVGSVVVTSAAGTYDDTTYPPVLSNRGTIKDTFTLTFTSGSAFSAAGVEAGSIGTGNTSANFIPINPDNGQPYFTLDLNGWGGTFLTGDTVVFPSTPSHMPIWLKEIVPAATSATERNIFPIMIYWQ